MRLFWGPLAQLVEQLAFNQLVARSNRARPTKFLINSICCSPSKTPKKHVWLIDAGLANRMPKSALALTDNAGPLSRLMYGAKNPLIDAKASYLDCISSSLFFSLKSTYWNASSIDVRE